MEDIIHINLRGTRFSTVKSTLQRLPVAIDTDERGVYDRQKNEYFFNRNPMLFHHILDYCESGHLHLPENICSQSIREELDFWGIPQDTVQQCCWKAFYKLDDEMDILDKLLMYLPLENSLATGMSKSKGSSCGDCRVKLWRFLQNSNTCLCAKIWKVLIVLTVLASLLVFMLESDKSFRDVFPLGSENMTVSGIPNATNVPTVVTGSRPKLEVSITNAVTNFILTVELILRIVSCPKKKIFFRSFLNISEIVSCIGIWIALYLEYFTVTFDEDGHRRLSFILVYLLCLFRVFRIFRFVVNNSGMRILMLSLRSSGRELCLLFLCFVSFAVMFATIMYVCEFKAKTFSNIFVAVWWAIITMTTVGYGDYAPVTPVGYLFGGICAIFGIMLIAMPVAVTSSNFNDFFNYNRYRSRHHHHVLTSRREDPDRLENGTKQTIRANGELVLTAWNCETVTNTHVAEVVSKTKVKPLEHSQKF